MKIYETLATAASFAASRWRAARAEGREEEKRLWSYVGRCRDFVHETGQVYRFEDDFKGRTLGRPTGGSATLNIGGSTLSRSARELLLKVLGETTDPLQAQHVRVLIALLQYLTDTGQTEEAEDFFLRSQEYAPMAIAAFTRREEAEAWLQGAAEPPSPARILIGDEYYQFWYNREDNTRDMSRDWVIEPTIATLVAKGIPPGTPSFQTRAEAEAWLGVHPATPEAFVAIAGEYHFALYHKRLRRHSLHSVATALQEWEARKQAIASEEAMETATPSEGDGE